MIRNRIAQFIFVAIWKLLAISYNGPQEISGLNWDLDKF